MPTLEYRAKGEPYCRKTGFLLQKVQENFSFEDINSHRSNVGIFSWIIYGKVEKAGIDFLQWSMA
jgi:hypothetical protein